MFDVIYVYISIGIKTQRDVLQELMNAIKPKLIKRTKQNASK